MIVALVVSLWLSAGGQPHPFPTTGRVERVVDGDTLVPASHWPSVADWRRHTGVEASSEGR
jgi:hypothetical protein